MSESKYKHRPKKMALADLLPDESILGGDPDRDLLASMQEYGMFHRIILTEFEDKLWLIDGGRRIKAARMLGWKEVDCEIYEGVNPFDRAAVSVILNQQRSINPIAEYHYLSQLQEEDYRRFLAVTKVDQAHAKKILSLNNIDADLREDFIQGYEDGKIAEGTLFSIAKVSKPRQGYLRKLLDTNGKLSGTDVRHAKQAEAEAILSANESLFSDIELPEVPERPQEIYIIVSDDLQVIGPYLEFLEGFDEAQSLGNEWRLFRLVEV